MKLYTELASWFHLLSAPADYAEEAEFAARTLNESTPNPIRAILELGSGGGNNASHMKASFEMTLVDLSPGMLELSRTINPECRHLPGDMRTVRLGKEFDAVFVHDAVCYLTTRPDLLQCMKTAFVHCRTGGAVLFMPDFVRERFVSSVNHGGHDGDGRGLRYFEWCVDPDPADTTYTSDFVYLLREDNSPVRVEHESHVQGLFSRSEWIECLLESGFTTARMIEDPYSREIFAATKGNA